MAEQAQQHTLGEVARILRISRHTLDKWLERLQIEPQRHAYDYRFFTITDDDLQRIREARAQMPQAARSGSTGVNIPSYSQLTFNRRESGEGMVRDVSPTVAPTPRLRPPQRDTLRAMGESLPEGMMSRTDVADLHHFPRSTLRRWCDEGRIETADATYGGEHGTFAVARPVTAQGLAQFYALAHRRTDFQRCPDCPHALTSSSSPSSDELVTPEEG